LPEPEPDQPTSEGSVVTTVPGGTPVPGAAAGEFGVEARSQGRMILRRFLRHRAAMISLVVLIALILLSLIGGRVWKYDYAEITPEFSTGPSLEHPMGTDGPGHDTFAQVLRGAQKSVQIMLLVALFSTGIGVGIVSTRSMKRMSTASTLPR
jgi:ABC-type dipeptide/oligopeptide/nickel transport system permease subunit